MTAFARAEGKHFVWEVRSVNQRHLDASFRIPEEYRVLEPELRNMLKGTLHRGKVECFLRRNPETASDQPASVNEEALRRIARLVDQAAAIGHNVAPVSPLDLLRWPGVMEEPAKDFDSISADVQACFSQALDELTAMRAREGSELERVVRLRLDELEKLVATVREQMPTLNERLLARMKSRIEELAVDADPGRIETELVILAQKADVQEELDRLDTHIAEIKKTLAGKGAVGRRLDFLMQELNREANTLSSKSSAADMSIQAVELKVLIEQMREQVQNIE